ncbi:M1 family aminopeptidase [Endozoicomonas arenosclerae]|uniref:M1 family aminopeptidase n=1 Tax=Endozoicomonas arenosclerae TaxID=1633495 RepID=UPI0007814579|nr:M1 family aminopeptidase [Endozoicomonas arenosclerae]
MSLPQVTTRTIVLLLIVFSLGGCFKFHTGKNNAQPKRPDKVNSSLTREEASSRQRMISNLGYELYLDVSETRSKQFSGRVSITFSLKQANQPLRLDFQQGEVTRLLINAEPANPEYNGSFITFAPGSLQEGQNIVEIEFIQNYRAQGTGLNHFHDPKDQQLYLFSQASPFNNGRIFPVFDQPDLKASYKLTVKSPEDWQVITVASEKQTLKEGDKRWWYFPSSEPISPSLFKVSSGPFRIWKDSSGKTPLRLLARKSLAKAMNPQSWFSYARHGLSFFETYFDAPYPSLKFDLVLLPRRTSSGNTDYRLLDEALIHSFHAKKYPEIQAQFIYHELAYNWVNRSVAPAWWDGTELHESLVLLMSYKAMAEGANPGGTWPYFYRNLQAPAYQADSNKQVPALLVKTESSQEAKRQNGMPLYQSVRGKGPAILRQLEYRMTGEAFRQGVRDYLGQNMDKGTKPGQFIQFMRDASGEKLKHWPENWLFKPGVNQVEARWECKDQFLTKITLLQSAKGPDKNIIRDHLLNVGLYRQKNHQLSLYRSLSATLDGKKAKVPFSGKVPCPDAVFPNTNDYGYIEVQLDEKTRNVALQNRGDSLLFETQLIDLLYQDVLQAKIDVSAMLSRLYRQIPEENTPALLFQSQQVLTELFIQLQSIRYQDESLQETLTDPLDELEAFVWQQLMIAIPGSIEQMSWFRTYLVVAHTPNGLAHLEDLLDRRPILSGLELTQTLRWDMLKKLMEYNYPGIIKRIDQEPTNTASSSEQSETRAAQALRPELKIKQQFVQQTIQQLQETSRQASESLSGLHGSLFPPSQIQLAQQVAGQTLDGLQFLTQKPQNLQWLYLNYIIPNACSVHGITQFKNAMNHYQAYPYIQYQLTLKKAAAEHCLTLRGQLSQR